MSGLSRMHVNTLECLVWFLHCLMFALSPPLSPVPWVVIWIVIYTDGEFKQT